MTSNLSSILIPRRLARLPSFSTLAAAGPDSHGFLQGQLTNDVNGADGSHHQRTGYCSPKGRLLTTMIQWKTGEHAWTHLLPAESVDRIGKRLKMYVLRSKVTVLPADQGLVALGLWGDPGEALSHLSPIETEGLAFRISDFITESEAKGTESTSSVWLLVDRPCPTLGVRGWLVGPPEQIATAVASLSDLPELPESAWIFSEIQSGKAWVWEATQDLFVPQMVNFELIRGVSFTKGCYPGQEVVARSQYLGKLKRRTFRMNLSKEQSALVGGPVTPMVGMDVWSENAVNEPCGRVVAAAPAFSVEGVQTEDTALLIELTMDAWAAGGLRLQDPSGPRLLAAELPYALAAAA
jgi:folate-binding protein YgfZ